MEEEERILKKRLVKITEERSVIREEIKFVKEEKKRMDGLEDEYFSRIGELDKEIGLYIEEKGITRTKLQNCGTKLKEIQKVNVIHDTFCISHEGRFGTINGLRLGRIPSIQVSWDEVNAAWGQTVLLLSVMAKQSGFSFSKYELSPMGSFSKIKVLSNNSFLQLYGTSNVNIGEMHWFQKFNSAMCAFAECVAQFAVFATTKDPSFRMDYSMEVDSIGGMPIKLLKDEEVWTRSMKYLLTNVKCLLIFVSRNSQQF